LSIGNSRAHLRRHGEIDHTFLAPLGPNGIPMPVCVRRAGRDGVGKLETEPRRRVHSARVAANHGLDLILGHAGFQRHVDGQLDARSAIFRHGAGDLRGKVGIDGDHLAMGRRLRQPREFEGGGGRFPQHVFEIARVITVTFAGRT